MKKTVSSKPTTTGGHSKTESKPGRRHSRLSSRSRKLPGFRAGGGKSSAESPPGESVKVFCQNYRVNREDFTRMTGFSQRAVANWAAGKAPGASAQKKVTELNRLFDALSELVDAQAIGPWLKKPNPDFEGSTPLQVIERGEADRIWRMIWELESGNSG